MAQFVDTFAPYMEARQRGQSRLLDLLTQRKNAELQNKLANETFTSHLKQTQDAEQAQRVAIAEFNRAEEEKKHAPIKEYFRKINSGVLTRQQAEDDIKQNHPELYPTFKGFYTAEDELETFKKKEKYKNELEGKLIALRNAPRTQTTATQGSALASILGDLVKSGNVLKVADILSKSQNPEAVKAKAEYEGNASRLNTEIGKLQTDLDREVKDNRGLGGIFYNQDENIIENNPYLIKAKSDTLANLLRGNISADSTLNAATQNAIFRDIPQLMQGTPDVKLSNGMSVQQAIEYYKQNPDAEVSDEDWNILAPYLQ